jgi:hypothetical protein
VEMFKSADNGVSFEEIYGSGQPVYHLATPAKPNTGPQTPLAKQVGVGPLAATESLH